MDPHTPPEEETREQEAERRERLAQLVLRRTALSPSEAALFRVVFPEIITAHYDGIWTVLRKRGARDADLDDLVQDVFLSFYSQALEQGFPDSIPAKLTALAVGKALNQKRGAQREPVSLGLPSSRSEKPKSGPEAERALDVKELVRRLLHSLSKEHEDVVDAIILRELTHGEAAAELGLPRNTVTSRLLAARQKLATLAKAFLPESQRGPS